MFGMLVVVGFVVGSVLVTGVCWWRSAVVVLRLTSVRVTVACCVVCFIWFGCGGGTIGICVCEFCFWCG